VASGNISFMLADSVGIMVLAIGETIVIIGRGIDLSVAPILGIAAIAVGFPAQNHNLNIFAALALVILIGIALGVGNGLLVSVASLRRSSPHWQPSLFTVACSSSSPRATR